MGAKLEVYMDDGSTNVKVGYIDGDDVRLTTVAHSFANGHTASMRAKGSPINFTIKDDQGERNYHFSPNDRSAFETTNSQYQLSDQNLLAIHYALHESGLKPQPVKLVVTLPLSDYYTHDRKKNTKKITAKIEHIKRCVTCYRGEDESAGFKISDVEVKPEGIPAVISLLEELEVKDSENSLVVDVGGTSTDLADIEGLLNSIKPRGFSHIGVSSVIEKVIGAITDHEMNQFKAGQFIIARNEREKTKRYVKDENIEAVLSITEKSIKVLAQDVVQIAKAFNASPDYVFVVGGGAPLCIDALKAAYPNSKVTMVELPQSATVKELAIDYNRDETDELATEEETHG